VRHEKGALLQWEILTIEVKLDRVLAKMAKEAFERLI
jgi:hypothetical protein